MISPMLRVGLLLAAVALAADVPLPRLRLEVDGDGCRAFIRNTHTAGLTAYTIEQRDYPGSSWGHRVDGYTRVLVAPGVEENFWFKNQTVCTSPDYVKVTGAAYVDGGMAGDAKERELILDFRRYTLLNTRQAIARIEAGRGKSKEELVAEFQAWRESISEPYARAAGIQYAVSLLLKKPSVEALEDLRRLERDLRESKPSLE